MCQTTKATPPVYVYWAGLVFVPLSLLFMEANWDESDTPSALTLASQSPRKYVDQACDNGIKLCYQACNSHAIIFFNGNSHTTRHSDVDTISQTIHAQYVVLTRILADDVNYGYEDECEKIVKKHNGVEIKNLKHLYQLINETKTGFVKIELNDGSILVFDAEEANKRTEIILKKHKIPSMTNLDI